MKKNKKILILFYYFFTTLFPIFVLNAQDNAQPQTQDRIISILCGFISWVRNLILIIALLSLIFGAYKIITAGGDPGRMEDAKKTIMIILIGMAFIVGISIFLQNLGINIPAECQIQ